MRLHIDGEEVTASAGDALFYQAGRLHEESSRTDSPFRTYYVGFTDPAMSAGHLPVRVVDQAGRLLQLTRWLYDEHAISQTRGDPLATEACNAFLSALAAEFQRLTGDDTPPLIRQIHAYISQHLGEPLALDDLAVHAGMSN